MKLRNLLLTSALFLTVGIVSAKDLYEAEEAGTGLVNVPVAGQSYENYYDLSHPHMKINLDYGKYSDMVVTLYDVEGSTWSQTLKKGENVFVNKPSEVTKIGVMVYAPSGVYGNPESNEKYYPIDVLSSQNEQLFMGYEGQYYSFTAYDATYSNTLLFGTNQDSYNQKMKITFGTPLPTPVVTLLIALGFGAAFVLYRNRKQVKA